MRSVLVVDDEMEICLLVTQYLKKLGYETAFARSITEAISKLTGTSYDILFIDLNLTDGSGYDLIHAMQASNNASKIVVISAYDSERQRALQKGANVFMAKPFSIQTIDESLQKLNFIT